LTRWRAALAVVVLAFAGVVLTASPASAHGLGGLKPTDYQTRFVRVSPTIAGLTLEAVDLGTKLELTNRSGHDVVVLGYDDEPYLRVGPRGVFENTRSPATYYNRTLHPTTRAPKQADPRAAPVWRHIGDGPTARWHDHRTHFMGTSDPPVVQRDRGQRHVIDRFEIKMRTNGRTVVATGEIVWVPPPSPWPWVALALVLAAAVVVLSRSSRWRVVFVVALAVLVVSELLHVIGLWGASTAASGTKLVQSAYSIGGILLALLALFWTRRKGSDAAVPLVLIAALFLFVAGGLADVTSLGNSQLPTTLPNWLARVLVAVNLGVGGGLALAAGFKLRPQEPASRRAARPPARSRPRAPVTN
jgi:hypothetical protein